MHNNPLLYTDPSGYFSVKSVLKLAAVVVISYVTAGIAGGAAWAAAFGVKVGSATAYAVVAAGGALSGFIMTGSVEGALWGAFSAMTFYGIGQWMPGSANGGGVLNSNYTGPELAAASLTHGAAGGVISHMQGGKFGHGFLSAGVTKLFSPAIHDPNGNQLAQTAIAAVVGGSVSQVTGGKFANGAVTAAMAFAFNQVASSNGRFRRAVDNVVKKTKFIGGFVAEEGPGIVMRTATTVGGGGQVLLGGALCTTVLGCSIGAPVATLGASNIQEGLSGEPGFVRAASQEFFGNTAGDLIIDGANLTSSVGGLARPVLRKDTFKLFRNVSSDFVPNYTTATRVGLVSEVTSSSVSTADSIKEPLNNSGFSMTQP